VKKVKADGLIPDTKITEFQYLQAKVTVLEEVVQLISDILKQNNLSFKMQKFPIQDIENAIWKSLKE